MLRVAEHCERADGSAAHGIDIAQRIRGCDLPIGVRIVDHRGEEVDRLDQRQTVAQLVDTSVIGRLKADEDVLVALSGKLREHSVQDGGAELAGASAGLHLLGKLYGLYFSHRFNPPLSCGAWRKIVSC